MLVLKSVKEEKANLEEEFAKLQEDCKRLQEEIGELKIWEPYTKWNCGKTRKVTFVISNIHV